MVRPKDLKTKIFLDSGDPAETREMIERLGFLDGQTTNPTLIAKNPDAKERFEKGEKFTAEEIIDFYQKVVKEISGLIPTGSVSIEVYADQNTTAEAMLKQGREFFGWIPNAQIKFPTTAEGLKAAEQAVKEGLRVNMTLCFSQQQAAAVHAATRGAKKGQVFVSPFVGRLDDIGQNGMDLIADVLKMYRAANSPVEVLTASVRSLDHFLYALHLGSDIITAPAKILREWADQGLKLPEADFVYPAENLSPIAYQDLDLSRNWQSFDISHDLTGKGIERFSADWNNLIKK